MNKATCCLIKRAAQSARQAARQPTAQAARQPAVGIFSNIGLVDERAIGVL